MNRVNPHSITLSAEAGDRATAYAMSNKAIASGDGMLCTWIDRHFQNRWALVDTGTQTVLREGEIGAKRKDNHCGAALARSRSAVHAILGAHHGAFEHYCMQPDDKSCWAHVASIPVQGTYPSLISDAGGRLHLAFRSLAQRWEICYANSCGGEWSPPRALVRAAKEGYIYWTNGLAGGPDGSLYLVFGNVRPQQDGSLAHGVSILLSDDSGRTWKTEERRAIAEPVDATELSLVPACDPGGYACLDAQALKTPPAQGPDSYLYLQMLLSNPVVDPKGRLHFVQHHGLHRSAALMTMDNGHWATRPLCPPAELADESPGIHQQSSVSVDSAERVHVALTLRDGPGVHWGPLGTRVHHLRIDPDSGHTQTLFLSSASESLTNWLPALEHPQPDASPATPALIYTCGRNTGGFKHNTNSSPNETICVIHPEPNTL
jgi:hypothetical protein